MRELNFQGQNLQGRVFVNMDLRGANFKDADLDGVDFRGSDLRGVNFQGANLFGSDLENTLLDNVIYDHHTKYYEIYCPSEGAFLAYKKCYNYRIVQLLVPADAKELQPQEIHVDVIKQRFLVLKVKTQQNVLRKLHLM